MLWTAISPGRESRVIRRRVLVYGMVQGVFFRESCRGEARRHNVSGWVTNRPDGTVEAHFEGEPEAVAALVAWAGHGPPHAVVERVETTDEEPAGDTRFSVR